MMSQLDSQRFEILNAALRKIASEMERENNLRESMNTREDQEERATSWHQWLAIGSHVETIETLAKAQGYVQNGSPVWDAMERLRLRQLREMIDEVARLDGAPIDGYIAEEPVR